ncbi:hypothetical protein CPHO_04555 [Corynebacterium phocae]|uniref:Uncharacterized protein n=1 Tax=Corynebacterium phocae TaxID=161895 RepID=A0A1L7D2S1_9CORY|nr:hypothetical protein CPHO_04555 [Corynebacterium phocae]
MISMVRVYPVCPGCRGALVAVVPWWQVWECGENFGQDWLQTHAIQLPNRYFLTALQQLVGDFR